MRTVMTQIGNSRSGFKNSGSNEDCRLISPAFVSSIPIVLRGQKKPL
jgi:hypothetical protein